MIYTCSLGANNDAVLSGSVVLNSLAEVYRVLVLEDTQGIIFEDDFVEKNFTPSGFTAFLLEAQQVNKFLDLTYSSKYMKHFDDRALALSEIRTYEEMVDYIIQYKEQALSEIHHLCEHYKSVHRETIVANNKLATMHLELSEMDSKLQSEVKSHGVTRDEMVSSRNKLLTLTNRINNKYGIDINHEAMDGIQVSHSRYSKILYVKELTRVIYVDTLLYYLQEIIKTVQGVPVRFVVIEPFGSEGRDYLYPRCKPYTSLTYKDVIGEDIFMSGFQPNIMEQVLKNPSNVEFLIVLDRSGTEHNHVTGDSVETIYTVSDLKDFKLNKPLTRLISYDPDTLHIPYVKGFEDLPMESRIGKYSSFEITKALIDLLSRRE